MGPRISHPLVIVVYGKGGVGKSTVSSHIGASLASTGRKVLLVGCDPKADLRLRLLGGRRVPTVIDAIAAGRPLRAEELIQPAPCGVDILETGGAEPGTACAGRGVSVSVSLLERNPAVLARYDVILFDVLGDLVCGGFVAPMRFGSGHRVVIVSSEEVASLFAANNIARLLGQAEHANAHLAGVVFNVRDEPPPGMLTSFASGLGTVVLETLRRDRDIRRAERKGLTAIELYPDAAITGTFASLAQRLLQPPDREARPTPLDSDGFWDFIARYRMGDDDELEPAAEVGRPG